MAKTFRYTHLLSKVSGATPQVTKLLEGEIAVNIFAGDEKMFLKNTNNELVTFIPEDQVDAKINALDKAASAENGKVVTTVVQTNGKVSETKENVKDLQLGGYQNDGSNGEIASADTIEKALSKLENKIGSNSISNEDHSIVVTAPTGTATTTDIKVNIKSGEKVIALSGDGIYTDIQISAITPSSANVKEEYALLATDGSQLGDTIKIYKDSSLYSVYLGHVDDTLSDDTDPTSIVSGTGNTALCFIYQKNDDTYELVAVDVESFLQESEFADGLQVNNHVVSVKIDAASEPFLTVSPDGVKLDGVQDAIDAAVESASTDLEAEISALSDKVDDLQDELDATQVGAGLESGGTYTPDLTTTYLSGATSLKDADKKLDAAIAAEVNRANAEEARLDGEIDTLSEALSAETIRAMSAETVLAEQIEEALSGAVEQLEQALSAETQRAINAEQALSDSIEDVEEDVAELSAVTAAEIVRSTSADTVLAEQIEALSGAMLSEVAELSGAVVEEIARATSAETVLEQNIDAVNDKVEAEIERAQSAETILQEAIDAEEARAMSAETALSGNISTLAIAVTEEMSELDDKIDELSGAVISKQFKTVAGKSIEGEGNVPISITELRTVVEGVEVADVTVDENTGDIILSAGNFS